MITTGGSDPYFATRAFTDTFLSEKELEKSQIRYHIISGPFNMHAEELHKLYDENPWVEIHEHVTCMKEIMKQCDVVLSATGSTIYEVSALGVPLIAFILQRIRGREQICYLKLHMLLIAGIMQMTLNRQ